MCLLYWFFELPALPITRFFFFFFLVFHEVLDIFFKPYIFLIVGSTTKKIAFCVFPYVFRVVTETNESVPHVHDLVGSHVSNGLKDNKYYLLFWIRFFVIWIRTGHVSDLT